MEQQSKASGVKVWTSASTVELIDQVSAVELSKSLYVFRRERSRRLTAHAGSLAANFEADHTVTEGFIDRANLLRLRRGEKWKSLTDFTLLPLDLIEKARLEGFDAAFQNFRQWPMWEGSMFDAFTEGRACLANLVQIDISNRTLSDHLGQPLPLALYCDYLSGGFDESRYDLDRAVKRLRRIDRAVLFRDPPPNASYEEREGKHPVPAGAEDPVITHVPSYNARSGRYRQIRFRVVLSVKDYRALIAMLPKKSGAWHTDAIRRAMFETDMLGLRRCKAALFDTFDKARSSCDEGDD